MSHTKRQLAIQQSLTQCHFKHTKYRMHYQYASKTTRKHLILMCHDYALVINNSHNYLEYYYV